VLLDDPVDEGRPVGRVGDVGDHPGDPGQAADRLRQPLPVTGAGDDAAALPGEPGDGRATDPGATAGDEDDGTLRSGHGDVLPAGDITRAGASNPGRWA
jgi:hypothetical protein